MAGSVLIIGGGIIGLSCAFEAASRGFQVTVIESGAFGGQASGAAAGMLAPYTENPDQPDSFFLLCRESLRRYPEWVERIQAVSGIDPELMETGSLTVALNEADLLPLQSRLSWQRTFGAHAELVETGSRLRQMEPLLTSRAAAALWCPEESHVHAPKLVAALEAACRRMGVNLVAHAGEAELVEPRSFPASGVLVRSGIGEEWRADRAVLCAGAWTCRFAETIGLSIPIHPIRGQICSYDVPYGDVRHMVFSSQAYWVGKQNGALVCGASEDVAGYDASVTERGIDRLVRWGPRLFPFLEGRQPVRRWAGLRPATLDGWPLIGRLPQREDIVIAAGHYRNGILLSPVTAQLVGDLLAGSEETISLAPFAMDRFSLRA